MKVIQLFKLYIDANNYFYIANSRAYGPETVDGFRITKNLKFWPALHSYELDDLKPVEWRHVKETVHVLIRLMFTIWEKRNES